MGQESSNDQGNERGMEKRFHRVGEHEALEIAERICFRNALGLY